MQDFTSRQPDAVIIGAGLTGLTTAFYLRKKGKKVIVIEKDERPGGAIRTFRENGFIFESGPNTGTLSNAETVRLFEELPDCKVQPAAQEAGRRLILKNGRLHALPAGIISGLVTPLFSLKDKFRILGEPFRARGTNPDETVAQLTVRRLGKSFLNYAVDPFISGIYAGDPHELTTRFALPKLYNLEQQYGSFIGGAIKKAKEPKTPEEKKVTKKIFSVEGGLENLITALVKAVGEENIILNNRHLRVSQTGNGWKLTGDQTEGTVPQVISTVGSYALPDIFSFVPTGLMQKINNLKYARIVQISIGLSVIPGMDFNAFGALIPSLEKRNLLGILYPSACFAGRCPQGKVILSVFLGGMRHPDMIDLSDGELTTLVMKELNEIFRMKEPLQPDYIRIFRHPYAIPQYENNTGERLNAVDEFQRLYPGIILGGNLKDGIGMADRIRQATGLAG